MLRVTQKGSVINKHGSPCTPGELVQASDFPRPERVEQLVKGGWLEEVHDAPPPPPPPPAPDSRVPVFVFDPKTLAGKSLEELNVMLGERGHTTPYAKIEEAVAHLSRDFKA